MNYRGYELYLKKAITKNNKMELENGDMVEVLFN